MARHASPAGFNQSASDAEGQTGAAAGIQLKEGFECISQLFQTIDRLQLGYEAREEAFRRLAFNVMAANCDDHTKNFAFLLREGERWALAPAYDVTHAHNPDGEWTNQHLMAVNGRFTGIVRTDLLAVAERFGIGTATKVLQRVGEAIAVWPDFAAEAKVTPGESKRIRAHHRIL